MMPGTLSRTFFFHKRFNLTIIFIDTSQMRFLSLDVLHVLNLTMKNTHKTIDN